VIARLAFAIVLCWSLGACGGVQDAFGIDDPFDEPKPFDQRDLATVPLSVRPQPIAVYPVVGLKTAEAEKLKKAIIERSNDSDVLAVEPEAPRPMALRGLLRRDKKTAASDMIHVTWFIVDPDGKELNSFHVEQAVSPAGKDTFLTSETFRAIASKTIVGMEWVLSGGYGAPISSASQSAQPGSKPAELPIFLAKPTGAPGDGNESLQKALATILDSDPNIVVVASRDKARVVIDGQIKLDTTAPSAAEKIEIVWRVAAADGAELGQVQQANTVPTGSLDKHWGDTALIVAQEAAGGIIDLFARLETAQN
jgi:hypothetical protein